MDFAPYQSSPPETTRSPTTSPRTSTDHHRSWSPFNPSPPPLQHPQPQRNWQPSLPGSFPTADARREGVSEFDTSLGFRLDYEAVAAYVALPPLAGIILLIAERNSDYVRYVFGDHDQARRQRGWRWLTGKQVPRVAVEPPLHGAAGRPPHPFVVELPELGSLPGGHCADGLPRAEGVPRCGHPGPVCSLCSVLVCLQ